MLLAVPKSRRNSTNISGEGKENKKPIPEENIYFQSYNLSHLKEQCLQA